MKTRTQILLALILVIAALGTVSVYALSGSNQQGAAGTMEGHDHSAMVAQAETAQPVTLAGDAAGRIGVTYARATLGTLARSVSTVGTVAFDETRVSAVNAKIGGWVERLYVEFTGAPVRAGQPLLEVFSPELISAQEELILARKLVEEAGEGASARARENAEALLAAARTRLGYWDIPEEEIAAMEERGSVSRTVTLRAPAGGVVVGKAVVEGARIDPGMELFRVADLSRVWIEAEAFEKDLSLIRTGLHGMVSLEAYPGEMFHGSVSYVYPTVSTGARTGMVRLELSNPELKLKPGMYASVELHLTGGEETVLVPRSAVLQTGERSIVFHRMSNGQLHPMEVVTGLSDRDQIQILSGLREGTVVAASATFLIDAESNLGAAMAGMAGMDHSGMDMGGGGGAGTVPDTGAMDHSGHDMSGMQPDTGAMDHSGHDMSGMQPDTSTTHDHGGHEQGPQES
jgi:Cu(I)/Ag(I) efflux system membrane fusion protein